MQTSRVPHISAANDATHHRMSAIVVVTKSLTSFCSSPLCQLALRVAGRSLAKFVVVSLSAQAQPEKTTFYQKTCFEALPSLCDCPSEFLVCSKRGQKAPQGLSPYRIGGLEQPVIESRSISSLYSYYQFSRSGHSKY